MLATWVELALVFQIQTGVRLAPDHLDLRSQEATAKYAWQPVSWSPASKPLIDHSRSGICRRPIVSNDIWKTGAGLLTAAHETGKSSETFGLYRRVLIKAHGAANWKPAVLQEFNDAIAKAVKTQITKDTLADEAMGFEHNNGPCHFGHASSSQRVNGREAWLKNPPVSWWPGIVTGGVTLCNQCYQIGYRAWHTSKKAPLPEYISSEPMAVNIGVKGGGRVLKKPRVRMNAAAAEPWIPGVVDVPTGTTRGPSLLGPYLASTVAQQRRLRRHGLRQTLAKRWTRTGPTVQAHRLE